MPVSPQNLAAIWRECAAGLGLLARARCDTPEDCVQEAFLKLAQQPTLPPNPRAWLVQVVRNLAINSARLRSRQISRDERYVRMRPEWFVSESIEPTVAASEYLGHGDTIVQKLVAISRCHAMNYVVREALSTPGCPNLYWALACLPEPIVSMRRSIDIECIGIEYSFPVLYNAESKDLGREQWQELWSETFETFASLKRMDANGNPDLAKQLELTFQRSMNADLGKARKSILSNGYSKEHVSSMCSEQLVALNALCEVRQRASQTAKASFLPSPFRERELEKAKAEQEKYMAENPTTICALLQFVSTAADAVNQTETKQICFVRQLMTLEAIRMHTAEHGSPPASLNDLVPVPALPNPFDGNPFVYKSIKEAAAWHIILKCEKIPNGAQWLPEQDFWIQMK